MQITSTDLGLAARVQNLTKTYGAGGNAVHALDGITVGIRRGEFTAIMGPSGSGKSTLMHVMAGLDAPTSGRAWIGDTDITGLSDLELTVLRRRRVGFVFQAFNLVPTLDVLGNIQLPFDLDGRRPTALERSRIDGLVDTLGLGARLRHRPHELSGGQQQRVAIARALATAPDLVFADEPTGNLDSRSGREVLRLLQTASREHGQSIAMVTHDPIAASHADRVLFLGDGRIVADKPCQSAEAISAFMLAAELGAGADADAGSGADAGSDAGSSGDAGAAAGAGADAASLAAEVSA
jgi:putative ABC transport system ATP-binding protein